MSLIYAIAVISLAVMFPVLVSLRKSEVSGTASFCVACILSAIASGIGMTGSFGPLWLHAVLGGTVVTAASLMTLRGFRQFLGRPPLGFLPIVIILAATAGLLILLSYGVDSRATRISVIAALAVSIHVIVGASILRHWSKKRAIAPYMLFCAVAAFLVAGLHAMRVVTVSAGFDGFGDTGEPHLWATALLAARLLVVPLFFLGIILMLHGWMIAHLRHMIAHDDLTGALSRRAFMADYERTLSTAAASGRQTAFLLLDLDRFKQINDLYGHAGGDAALADFSRTVQATLAGRGILGRLGGEEFGIVIDNTDGVEATEIARAICSAVRDTPAGKSKGMTIALTVSIGLAMADGSRNVTDVMVQADVALYEAKALGRDRLSVAEGLETASAASARALAGAAAQMRTTGPVNFKTTRSGAA